MRKRIYFRDPMQIRHIERLEDKVEKYEALITKLRDQVSDLTDQAYALRAENQRLKKQ